MNYSREEKVAVIVDICKKLQNFPGKNGSVNFYNNNYTFLKEFKEITNRWINEENSSFKGTLMFKEINKPFEYEFPDNKNIKPLFVLRHKI